VDFCRSPASHLDDVPLATNLDSAELLMDAVGSPPGLILEVLERGQRVVEDGSGSACIGCEGLRFKKRLTLAASPGRTRERLMPSPSHRRPQPSGP
jgi:hypothetical protein